MHYGQTGLLATLQILTYGVRPGLCVGKSVIIGVLDGVLPQALSQGVKQLAELNSVPQYGPINVIPMPIW